MVSGSLDFMFSRKGVFRIAANGINIEELELELIDFGLEEIEDDGEGHLIIYVPFTEFGSMQKAIEDKKLEMLNAELVRVPTNTIELTEEQENEVQALLDLIEEDDDITNVYTNIK